MEGQVTETDLNNAGADCMRLGRVQVAWDLFKGALELHLAREKKRADPNVTLSGTAQGFISQAKNRYNAFLSMRMANNDEVSPSALIDLHGDDENFCHFFIFRNPIKIPTELPSNALEGSLSACLSGLIIILNMALLEHYRNPWSKQSISLYKLAASLLMTKSSMEAALHLVILNNVGIWHQQNGYISLAENYMARAAKVAETLPIDDSSFTPEEWHGIIFNLQWFAAPRFKVSPAA